MYMQDLRIRHCLDNTVKATEGQGVQQFACNGTCEDDWPQVTSLHCQRCHQSAKQIRHMMCLALQVAQLAERHHNIKPNFGLHPWYNPFTQLWQRSDQPLPGPACVS